MLFHTDKQTLQDLHIFGRSTTTSIYNIYNLTFTKVGSIILSEMFTNPLSEVTAINQRIEIFRYFADHEIEFPFQGVHFDVIESYLENTDERTKLAVQDLSLVKKLGNIIGINNDTSTLYKGVIAIATLLKELDYFINDLDLPTVHAYQSEKVLITLILANPELQSIIDFPDDQRLTAYELESYDLTFRFKFREDIRRLISYIGFIDVYCAVAKVAAANWFIFPKALPKEFGSLHIEGLYHPHVKNAVPNDFTSTQNSNVTFLTGVNMAGKSTFMKALGVSIYLAHMGFPVAATRMEFSVMDGLYTTINLPDNLGLGVSHFYAEVLRVKMIAKELKLGKKLFVIIDEMFRGTNVKDAHEATVAVTAAFAAKRNSKFLISTHIIEAGEILKARCDNVCFKYLPTQMEGSKPIYSYKLKPGITSERHGMVIINNEGILQMLKDGLEKRKKTL